ncbi:MAG: potassium transporter Kup [Pararhizobium sp.]
MDETMLESERAAAEPQTAEKPAEEPVRKSPFFALTLGSIGVVYGDIGTSPLYAFREALRPVADDGLTHEEILGVTSLLIWTLIIIVSLKYVALLLRADNNGEGGMLALLALVQKAVGRRTRFLILLGVAGCALFFGDAIITPAISVLSAIEGLELVTPTFVGYVDVIAVVILIVLFAVQSQGTAAVARFFGPIMVIWFIVMAAVGVFNVIGDPMILWAINPIHAIRFFMLEKFLALVVLGAVFLAVTGAEALYADLGHFGRSPIQTAWFGLVFPSLALNYLGQGAMVLHDRARISDPFFLMFPHWALLPIVILATVATIIASQAVISGAFSLTRQAIQLGFLPRMEIRHTSEEQTGQIFIPIINTLLLVGVLVLVVMFEKSEALATAYGIAVTGTMIVTTILTYDFLRLRWSWSMPLAFAVLIPLGIIETIFFMANMTKFLEGGYLPIMVAGALFIAMWTWTRGTAILFAKTRKANVPMKEFAAMLARKSDHGPAIVTGTAIFLTSDPETAPAALLHNLKHNHVLHEQNIILTVKTAEVPTVPPYERFNSDKISDRFQQVELTFGFMETPNVSQALVICRKEGLKFDIMSTSFYLGRRKLVEDPKTTLPRWQDRLFISLANTATDPTEYFRLPANRVVELGSHVSI